MNKRAFNRLPERLRKPVNESLYDLGYGTVNDLLQTAQDVRESRDIDKAYGKTLDYIGANVGQLRAGESDEIYRLLIKTKIISNLSSGDIPTINEVSKVLLGDTFNGVSEAWYQDEWGNEQAAIVFDLNPEFGALPYEVLERTIAGGVGIKWIITFKSEGHQLFIGNFLLTGENITIYPKVLKEPNLETTLYYGMVYEGIHEEVNIDSFVEPDDIATNLDVRNIGNLINQLEQIVLYSDKGGDKD